MTLKYCKTAKDYDEPDCTFKHSQNNFYQQVSIHVCIIPILDNDNRS